MMIKRLSIVILKIYLSGARRSVALLHAAECAGDEFRHSEIPLSSQRQTELRQLKSESILYQNVLYLYDSTL
jgi:hypothetical protein